MARPRDPRLRLVGLVPDYQMNPRRVPRMKHYFMSSDYFALPERKTLAEVDSLRQW